MGKNIFHIVIEEGPSTWIMSISCWKSLGSLSLMTSWTILKEFDDHTFHPHGIITIFSIEIAGKIVSIKLEMVDASLDYNLLTGNTWFYQMKVVTYPVFCVKWFSHLGKIVTIDKLNYYAPNLRTNASTNVPFFSDYPKGYASVYVGLFKDPC